MHHDLLQAEGVAHGKFDVEPKPGSRRVAGQAFDITDVPNGNYGIVVRVNPLGALQETSTADDVAVRRIRLLGRRGVRRVEAAPWHGIRG